MIDDSERLLIKREIAAILDFPSIYMGGPSVTSLKKAEKIISLLEKTGRLKPTDCDHSDWQNFKQHGTSCPKCGMICKNNDGSDL